MTSYTYVFRCACLFKVRCGSWWTPDLEAILERADLSTLLSRFRTEKIDATIIETMRDDDLIRLGVTTIGDRIRLRHFIYLVCLFI